MPLNHTRIQAARSVIQTTLGVLIFGDILTLSVGIFAGLMSSSLAEHLIIFEAIVWQAWLL